MWHPIAAQRFRLVVLVFVVVEICDIVHVVVTVISMESTCWVKKCEHLFFARPSGKPPAYVT